ncbi:BTAD domain-containing putative transcriptional regulator [Pseudonocardia acaciae]|uniref:BTAD domain-containing putative transcriptional regulator n=1 Tax=Pseudonocardia acaciae TaxID=551276 RepID=UPI000490E494|nr:BTAD domain-containing putative transcriptional regulator [Pseudonocardia acaciae]
MFGELVRGRRRLLGLSQREVADRAGMSLRAIRNIELGHVRRPHGESLRRLSHAIGLPERWTIQVKVLGPLELSGHGDPFTIGSMKVRCLLALLALRANQAVGQAEIVDVLWDDSPPDSAINLVHTYVARLRRVLRDAENPVTGGPTIVATRGGYRMSVRDDQLDAARFRAIADRARVSGSVAHCLLADALDCWRGPVLADLPATMTGHPSALALAGLRLAVALDYADVMHDLGHDSAAVERLRTVAYEEPLHERLNAKLMRALAAAGQRAAALHVFERTRARLASELGIQPCPELREAHLRIVRE